MIFQVGMLITTNNLNIFKIIASNEYSIVVQDTLTDDFEVLRKNEHSYEAANPKAILKNCVIEVLEDGTDIKEVAVLINNMVDKWL